MWADLKQISLMVHPFNSFFFNKLLQIWGRIVRTPWKESGERVEKKTKKGELCCTSWRNLLVFWNWCSPWSFPPFSVFFRFTPLFTPSFFFSLQAQSAISKKIIFFLLEVNLVLHFLVAAVFFSFFSLFFAFPYPGSTHTINIMDYKKKKKKKYFSTFFSFLSTGTTTTPHIEEWTCRCFAFSST